MTAILIPTSTEAEWLAARRQGISASEIAVVMGLSPYSSPFALYHQKLGTLPGQDETDAMALGKHMESFIAGRFAERHPDFYIRGDGRELYAHPDRAWQMATPDRLVHDTGPGIVTACTCPWPEAHPCVDHELGCEHNPGGLLAVLECKIDGGSDDWGDEGTSEIPVHYRCQVLWQMDVMGVTTGYLACLLWHRRQVRVYEIAMDWFGTEDLKLMRREAERFLARIENKDEPDIDWRPATRSALKHLHPSLEDREVPVSTQLAQRYQSACRNLKAAEQRKARWENEIRAALGTGRYAVDRGRPSPGRAGLVIARRDVYDLAEKTITRKASTVDRLVPVTPRTKEQP
jgi:putative phage-type endonuclease